MAKQPEPVTAAEVTRTVLATLMRDFGDRLLDVETAQRGLAQAAHELIMAHLREAAKVSAR